MWNKQQFLDRLPGRRASFLPRNRPLPLIYRILDRQLSDDAGQDALGRDFRLATVEAALMAADEPLTARRLTTVAGLTDAAESRRLVARLQALYEQDGSAFQVEELAGGWQLLTKPEYHPWLSRSAPGGRGSSADAGYARGVDHRGVSSADHPRRPGRGARRTERRRAASTHGARLVRLAGRDETLGRPQLYGTTKKFLQTFGFKNIRDLPPTEGVGAAVKETIKEEQEEEAN